MNLGSCSKWLLLPGFALVGFHLYLVFAGLLPSLVTLPLHLMLTLPWVFLIAPGNDRFRDQKQEIGSITLGLMGLVSAAYVVTYHPVLARQFGSVQGIEQYVIATVLVLVVLEMARRTIGWVLPLIALLALLYGLSGQWLQGLLGHGGLPLNYFLGTLAFSEGGLWSPLMVSSAEVIAPFVLLGAFISTGATGQGFMALSTWLAGRFRAGEAKVAVVSSALYGTISGVASANTAATGMVTISAMKRMNYPPSLAAAVEAVASTGGQIMPPVMGAGAFLMAELLGVRYTEVMVAAFFPALLFFITVWLGVHLFAIKLDLKPLAPHELPQWQCLIKTVPCFVLPFGVILNMLVFTSYTAAFAAVVAIVITWLLLLVDSEGRWQPAGWWERFTQGVVTGASQVASIAAILFCASLIVAVFHMTGLGVKLTSLIFSASKGNLWTALILTGMASLVLGMELPTTAAYVIASSVAAPALTALGLPELHTHLFIFWYALLCTITPPVCGNVFIAAGIADTPWLPVAIKSMQIGIGLFIVPLGFVANPSLLALTTHPWLALLALAKLTAGVGLMASGVIGPFRQRGLRFLALGCGVLVIFLWGV